jgi:hypothetical protein
VFAIAVAIVAWQFPAGGLALGLFALALALLADACKVTRHLFLFNAIWDICFFAAICALALGKRMFYKYLSDAMRQLTGNGRHVMDIYRLKNPDTHAPHHTRWIPGIPGLLSCSPWSLLAGPASRGHRYRRQSASAAAG